ncbi:MAG TPA: hypothetical protein VL134_03290 [Leptolyngbya sp.]|nr:hypothetical protein [Leptolyngbya sp.]
MEKLVSLMMSAIVLTLSAARSIQAQPFLDFTPNASPSIPKTPIAAQSVRSQPSEEASFSQAETPTAVKSVGLPVEFSTPSNSPPEPTVQSSNVADRAVMAVSDEDDRLVAVLPDDLFEGGSNSLVAKAIGSAEGTRTPDGGKTWA